MSRTFSDGAIRKRCARGKWQWQGIVIETHDGKRKQHTKLLGVPCDPPTDDERGQRVQTGAGSRQAKAAMREWRDGIVGAAAKEAAEVVPMTNDARLKTVVFMDRYWQTRSITSVTMDGYRKLRRHMAVEELDVPLARLTAPDVQDWVDGRLDAGVSENTMNKALAQLRYACKWAVEMGWLTANPTDGVKPPKRSKRGPNPLDVATARRVATQLENIRAVGNEGQRLMADAALLSLNTGMRIGELCGLQCADVDGMADGDIHAGGLIHVRRVVTAPRGGAELKNEPKSGEIRDVPMSMETVRLLRRIREDIAKEERSLHGCFVLSHVAHRRDFLPTPYLSKVWGLYATANGVVGANGERARFHDLRHTWATLALVSGVDVATVSHVLGHRNSATTLRYYARWLPRPAVQAVDTVSELVGRS